MEDNGKKRGNSKTPFRKGLLNYQIFFFCTFFQSFHIFNIDEQEHRAIRVAQINRAIQMAEINIDQNKETIVRLNKRLREIQRESLNK